MFRGCVHHTLYSGGVQYSVVIMRHGDDPVMSIINVLLKAYVNLISQASNGTTGGEVIS